MEKIDQLWPGGPQFLFDDTLFQPSTDSFLLGAFPRLHRGDRVCDLGSGTGLLGLLLHARQEGLSLTNVEIDPAACALNRRSYEMNALAADILCRDLREKDSLPSPGSFELVLSNPPYFDPGQGAVAAGARGVSRSLGCTPGELCAAAERLLKFGGEFALIYPTGRMAELFACLERHHLEPKRLRLIQNTVSSTPSLFLLSCKKGGHRGLVTEPVLLLKNPDGTETEDVKRAYFREKET